MQTNLSLYDMLIQYSSPGGDIVVQSNPVAGRQGSISSPCKLYCVAILPAAHLIPIGHRALCRH